MTDLDGDSKRLFLIVIFSHLRTICEANRYDPSDKLLNTISLQICKENVLSTRKEVENAVLSYLEIPPPDFFTLLVVTDHVKKYLQERALKSFEEKRLKNDEEMRNAMSEVKADSVKAEFFEKWRDSIAERSESQKGKYTPVADKIREKFKN